MRKCKKCGVDISYRGNRSQYCEKHSKEIRNEKVKQNKKRKYQRDNPKSTLIRTYKPKIGTMPLSATDAGHSDKIVISGSGSSKTNTIDRPTAIPAPWQYARLDKIYKCLEPSIENPLREYYYLYKKGKLSKSDYDKERYRQKKINELHESQIASINHKWRNRKPHASFWRKQVKIINSPRFKSYKEKQKHGK